MKATEACCFLGGGHKCADAKPQRKVIKQDEVSKPQTQVKDQPQTNVQEFDLIDYICPDTNKSMIESCNANGGNVTEKQNDGALYYTCTTRATTCSNCLHTSDVNLKPLTVADFKFGYDPNYKEANGAALGIKDLKIDHTNFIRNMLPKKCPITSCKLTTKDGSLDYKGSNIIISPDFPFKITALTNVTDGYSEEVRIQCTNGD